MKIPYGAGTTLIHRITFLTENTLPSPYQYQLKYLFHGHDAWNSNCDYPWWYYGEENNTGNTYPWVFTKNKIQDIEKRL